MESTSTPDRSSNDDGTLRPGISASTDLDAFADQWDVPGMVYTAYRFQPDPNILFGRVRLLEPVHRRRHRAVQRSGLRRLPADVRRQCADVGSTNYVIVANAPGNQVTIVVVVQTVTAADEAAYQHILETFNVDPNVSMPTETVPPDTTHRFRRTPLPTTPVADRAVSDGSGADGSGADGRGADRSRRRRFRCPTSPALPTSPLLTTPVTVPVVTTPGTSPNGVPAGYQVVTDDTGRLSVQVPSTWTDIDGAPGVGGGHRRRRRCRSAPNLTTFRETFDGPGLLIHETPFEPDPAAELARRGLAGTCTAGPVTAEPEPGVLRRLPVMARLRRNDDRLHVLVANPVDGRQVTVVMVVQTITAADEEALKVAFSSYRLNTTV